MKKIFLLSLILLFVIGSLYIFNSCKKNNQDIKQIAKTSYYNQSKEFLPSKEDVIPLIKQFKISYENYLDGLKSSEDMPLYQALWTLESTVNYDYASDKDSTDNFTYDSIFVYIDSYLNQQNELILTGESIMDAYQKIFSFIFDQLNNGTNDILIVGDLIVVEADTPVTTYKFSMVTGSYILGDLSINNTDYWFAAMGLGKCGPYIGQNIGWDASTRLDQVLNWNHGMQLACGNGGTLFYTSIDEITLYEGPNGWLFWNGPAADECLDPSDMNYWWGVAEDEIEVNRPSGKVFIDVIFTWDFWYVPPTFLHMMDPVRYGIPNCTGTPE